MTKNEGTDVIKHDSADRLMGEVTIVERSYQPSPLALLTDEQFDKRLEHATTEIDRLLALQLAIMTEGVDYGLIPKTDKKTLFQPGAQKLNKFFGYTPLYEIERLEGDGVRTPPIGYSVRCRLVMEDGTVVGEGYGSGNSWEKKHRYRYNDRKCPECGEPTIRTSKKTDDSAFYCWRRIGGCGNEYAPGAASKEIEIQPLMIENPDPHDLDNTLLKMACKRAYVGSTVVAHACSGQFSQDTPVELGEPSDEDAQSSFHVAAEAGSRTETSSSSSDSNGSLASTGRVNLLYGKLRGRFKDLNYDWNGDTKKVGMLEVLELASLGIAQFEECPADKVNVVVKIIERWVKADTTDTGQA